MPNTNKPVETGQKPAPKQLTIWEVLEQQQKDEKK